MKLTSKSLSYMALFVGMHIVLEYVFKIIPSQMQGGNVTLSLLPIFLSAYLMGTHYGVIVALTCSLMQFVLGLATFYGPWSVILDYVLPLMVLAIAPLFKTLKVYKKEVHIGIIITMVFKYFIHVVSGGWLFALYAPKNMNPWIYSLAYNFLYNFLTLIITLIVFEIIYPRIKNNFHF